MSLDSLLIILPEVFSSKNCILVLIRLSTTLVWMFLLMLMKMRLLTYLPTTVTMRHMAIISDRPDARLFCYFLVTYTSSLRSEMPPFAKELALAEGLSSPKSLKVKARKKLIEDVAILIKTCKNKTIKTLHFPPSLLEQKLK